MIIIKSHSLNRQSVSPYPFSFLSEAANMRTASWGMRPDRSPPAAAISLTSRPLTASVSGRGKTKIVSNPPSSRLARRARGPLRASGKPASGKIRSAGRAKARCRSAEIRSAAIRSAALRSVKRPAAARKSAACRPSGCRSADFSVVPGHALFHLKISDRARAS